MGDRKLLNIELHRVTAKEYKELPPSGIVVVLDNIRSAHNVGSAFRSSDAFKVDKMVLCGISAMPPSAEIHKSALGAEDSVDWVYYSDTAGRCRCLGFRPRDPSVWHQALPQRLRLRRSHPLAPQIKASNIGSGAEVSLVLDNGLGYGTLPPPLGTMAYHLPRWIFSGLHLSLGAGVSAGWPTGIIARGITFSGMPSTSFTTL